MYSYRQLFGVTRIKFTNIEKPTGVSYFPWEPVFPAVKQVVEKECNLVFYKQHERGGHFAALEKPEELWQDMEEFVGKVWKV
jgi:microsomal epoxide hydrolase